jgi:ubiquinone/menaquinone biosynthesis C-methylase UbiE
VKGLIMGDGRRIDYGEHAKLDSDERLQRQPVEPLVNLIAEALPQTVVDIGAGTGFVAIPLALELHRATIHCVDSEPRMLDLIRERGKAEGIDDQLVLETIDDPDDPMIPLGDDDADAVVMVNLYHELDDRMAYLSESYRVLDSGGRIVLCDWDPEGDTRHGPIRKHRVNREQVSRELRRAGFDDIAEHPIYDDFWVLSAEKP